MLYKKVSNTEFVLENIAAYFFVVTSAVLMLHIIGFVLVI